MRKEVTKLEAVPEGKLSRDRAVRLAPAIFDWAETEHKAWARTPGADRSSYAKEAKTPVNSLAKLMDENKRQLADDPDGPVQRTQWRQIFDGVKENLAKHGVNLENADAQAVLWAVEQKLFQPAGSRNRGSYDYLDSAWRTTRKVKTGELPALHYLPPAVT
jgi:hypothetical protein